jgi:nucleotide-binding universal stress UspA family protein
MVPLDGSAFAERALPMASLLARRNGSGMHLVRVHQPPLPVVVPGGGGVVHDPALDLELEHEGRQYLLGRIKDQERWRTVTAYLRGPVTECLSGYVRDHEIDLVVMTTHARGGVGRAVLGSVADGLVRHSVAPVLLVRPGAEAPPASAAAPVFRRVLLPVDGGAAEDRMIEHAIAVAGTAGVEYTLLRVVTSGAPSVHPPRPRRGEDPGSRAQRATVQVALGVKAEELRARGLLVRPEVVVDDDPAEGILGYGAENDFDLIAMATRSRGGLERLLLGSVADRVLRRAEITLLLWNPAPASAPVQTQAPGLLEGIAAPAPS